VMDALAASNINVGGRSSKTTEWNSLSVESGW
jgi:hypothetical protein